MNQQKLLYSLIGLLVLILAFLGGYLLNQKSEPANISGSLERFSENTPSPLKQTAPKLAQISSSRVIAATNGDSEDILYIEKESGKIIKTDRDGINHQTISGIVTKNIAKAVWPPNSSGLAPYRAEGSGSGPVYYIKNALNERAYYFNLKNGKTHSLSESISSVVFSPDGEKIAYHFQGQTSEEGTISISQPDGSSFKEVIKTRAPALTLDWPKESLLSFHKRATASEAVDLFLLEITGQKLSKILESKTGLDIFWSPDGDFLLYSFFSSDGVLNLVLREAISGKEQTAPFSTFASKCVFSLDNNSLYCGVPLEAPSKPVKPEHLALKDKIVFWNKSSGEVKTILEPASFEEIQVRSPFLSPLGNQFLFINPLDEKLYRLNL